MKSIGARLAVWYALASTAAAAGLFLAGYYLLESYLVHGLDLLNASEFAQIKSRLGSDYKELKPVEIDERIRQTTEFASVLFYIEIHETSTGTIFSSRNLRGQAIPDIPGKRVFDVEVEPIGRLRVGEFLLGPMDVMIATSAQQISTVMEGYVEVFAGLALVMIVASGGIGFGLSRMALRPVRLIQETAGHIGSDNLGERIPVAEVQDEISNLARLLNQMFDRLETSFNQVRRFSAEASHELKTPLSLVRLHAERMLMRGDLTPAQEESVQVQLEEIGRLNSIIEELLFISRAEARAITLDRRLHDPRKFLESFTQDARVLAESRGIRLADKHTGEGLAEFDARWMRQVLLNLLSNALNVSPPDGQITLESALADGAWRVVVADEGPGVPPEQLERIFERFVRLAENQNETGQGSGLGLAICRSIIQLHNGRIRAELPAAGRGLLIVFELPVTPADARPKPGESEPAAGEAATTRN